MSPRRRPTPSLFAVAAAAALLLAGCSTGTSGTATSSPAPVAGTSATAAAASPTAAPVSSTGAGSIATDSSTAAGQTMTSAPASTSESTPVSTSGSAGGHLAPAEPAQCASATQVYGAIVNATLPILQGKTGPEPFDADQLTKALNVSTVGTLPAELAPDFAAFKTAADKLKGKDLTAAADLLNGPEITKASTDIDKFLSDHC